MREKLTRSPRLLGNVVHSQKKEMEKDPLVQSPGGQRPLGVLARVRRRRLRGSPSSPLSNGEFDLGVCRAVVFLGPVEPKKL